MIKIFGNSWDEILKEEIEKEYFKDILKKIDDEYEKNTIYPKKENIFNSLKYTD